MSNSWLLVTVTALLAVFVQSDEISFIFDEEIRNQLYYPQCYHTDQVVEENAGTPKPEAPVVPVADQTGDKKTAAETNIQPVDSIDASSGPHKAGQTPDSKINKDQVVEENAGTPKPEAPVVPVADQTGDKKTAAETNIQPVDSIDASSGPRQRRNGGRNNGGQRRNGGRNNGVSPINNGVESNNVVS
ncbi:unnamed protein product [Schistosoma turkestanicum]|nr:unnamed protein product [Schistosoma turkestanicum]